MSTEPSDSVFSEPKNKRTKTPHKNKLDPIESKGSKARQPSPSKKDKTYYASANGDVFTFKDAVLGMEGEDIIWVVVLGLADEDIWRVRILWWQF